LAAVGSRCMGIGERLTPRNTPHTHARVTMPNFIVLGLNMDINIISRFVKSSEHLAHILGSWTVSWLKDLFPRTCHSPTWVFMPNLMVLVKPKQYGHTCRDQPGKLPPHNSLTSRLLRTVKCHGTDTDRSGTTTFY